MKLIKLNAIDSTNTFLKDLSLQSTCENFTVVVAKNQLQGKGQMGAVWQSEKGKNLTFSVLVSSFDLKVSQQFYLSMYVAVTLQTVLEKHVASKIKVKWPNDILADGLKVAGILIENTVKGAFIDKSIIGIGLNVNQEKFASKLPKATSMQIVSKKMFDLDELLFELLEALKNNISMLKTENHNSLKQVYLSKLYKLEKPTMFRRSDNSIFMGKITGISNLGKLEVTHDDDTTHLYALKEISLNEF